MTKLLVEAFESIKINKKDWNFSDLRINIPPNSFGSDAINPHTQYSNPIACVEDNDFKGFGASFTLGEGNQMICEATHYIVEQLNGLSLSDIVNSERGFYETLTNPSQIRWLSPNSGVPLMAAGLFVNTVIDLASKRCNMPAWEYLSRLPSNYLLNLLSLRHLSSGINKIGFKETLDLGFNDIDARILQLKEVGLPVYYTTWIGHSAQSIISQINEQFRERGISRFKLKISPDIEADTQKIQEVKSNISKKIKLCVDANQTLSLSQARLWMEVLSDLDVCWLEEPFAPDNISLFKELAIEKKSKGWSCEIATGENCPNSFTAAALMESGIDRYQADPCRQLGLVDNIITCCVAKQLKVPVTPHAGGSSLDELSPHIQLFNLARVDTSEDPLNTLTENVGFCSHYFKSPTKVSEGRAHASLLPGLLVGLDGKVEKMLCDYKEGISWLEL